MTELTPKQGQTQTDWNPKDNFCLLKPQFTIENCDLKVAQIVAKLTAEVEQKRINCKK